MTIRIVHGMSGGRYIMPRRSRPGRYVPLRALWRALADREEWMRGRAMATGPLVWSSNAATLTARYGGPTP